jgi:hypothetical protein
LRACARRSGAAKALACYPRADPEAAQGETQHCEQPDDAAALVWRQAYDRADQRIKQEDRRPDRNSANPREFAEPR